ncbi:MAG: IS66 family transposase [Promethearchaeota archaeon]|jgi:transposase
MKLEGINVKEITEEAESLLAKDESLSPECKSVMNNMITIIKLLSERFNLNSKNSNKPPSEDKNRERGSQKGKSDKKAGGQDGHIGSKLEKTDNPDVINEIEIDRRTLPKGEYKEVGFQSRQVFDIRITKVVTEYRAQILEDQVGNRYVAKFPEHVKSDTQYGEGVKNNAVYMSQYQLLPYKRIQEQFSDQMNLPISTGSIFNFNKEAYDLLEDFEKIAKNQLASSPLLHADETGININKKLHWLHTASNEKWVHFEAHKKRGNEAMDEIGIIPNFNGILCHDHWKAYYRYNCLHALCNSHHRRELIYAHEQDDQEWAKTLKELLLEINKEVKSAGGKLDKDEARTYRKKYQKILEEGGKNECPPPIPKPKKKGCNGKLKKTKSRNLLERLLKYKDDVLRFMENKIVPFTNNIVENDHRMVKVQQKISGCFRSMEGARMFCRIRGYLLTCKKNGIEATDALSILFRGEMPDFVNELLKN